MKITTRISFGYGLFMVGLLILMVYQIFTIHRIQSFNRTVSGIDFQNTLVCLQTMKDLDLVEKYTRKYFSLANHEDLKLFQEYQQEFANSLKTLKYRTNSDKERIALQRLENEWNSFLMTFSRLQQQLPLDNMPVILQEELKSVEAQIRSVYQANLDSMASKVERSSSIGETAAFFVWFTSLIIFIAGILTAFLICRSISKPLAHLIEGTRAIAEGKSFYRLDTTRDDELSQLAKDINAITRRLGDS
jgi:methyl-accepting chemotaxis protein